MAHIDADRLTFDDTLFETMRRALGTPVVSQTVWRFAETLDLDALRRFHAGLTRGPLNRVLQRSPIPAARDRWVAGSAVPQLELGDEVEDVLAWVGARAETPLDPEHGPTWALAYAPVTDGGSALSFVTSHVVADGSLKLLALEAAASGERLAVLPSGAVTARPRDVRAGVRSDLADALRQLSGAARALPGLVRRSPPTSGGVSTAASPPTASDDDGLLWTPPVAVVDLPAADWQRAADVDGGTANVLLLAVCAELAASVGRADPGQTIRVASPVSTRTVGDLRSNASTGVSVPVALDGNGRVSSLAHLRVSARTAYAALQDQDPADDPLAAARALLPLVPDALVRRLAPSWPAPLVLASNLGALSPTLVAPTGTPAGSVLNRSITPPTSRGAARRTRAGLSAWWGTAGPTATLCVAGADPDAFPDIDTLQAHLDRVLDRRGLHGISW